MVIVSVGSEDHYKLTTVPAGRKSPTTQQVRVPNSGRMLTITPGDSTSEAYALSLSIGTPSDLRLLRLDLNNNTCLPVDLPPLDGSPIELIAAELFYSDGTMFALCTRGLLTITLEGDVQAVGCRLLSDVPPYLSMSRFQGTPHVWVSGKLCYPTAADELLIVDTESGDRTIATLGGGRFDRLLAHEKSLYAWTNATDRVSLIDLSTGQASSVGTSPPCAVKHLRTCGFKLYDFETKSCYPVEYSDVPFVPCRVYCIGPEPLKFYGTSILDGFVYRQESDGG